MMARLPRVHAAVVVLFALHLQSCNFVDASAIANQTTPPSASTKCGTITGAWETVLNHTVAHFSGIPYAEPPVEDLRFMPSMPATCDQMPAKATKPSTSCYNTNPIPGKGQADEDCLYADVWVPQQTGSDDNSRGTLPASPTSMPDKKLPVFFWIYGGSNTDGSTYFYTGLENLAPLSDVCVVAVNYRLNIFGYLVAPELAEADPRNVSGNYGITDIQLGLKWVQDNIAGFGCDPKNVTVYGQSSGGTNILALLSSPASKGLFHAAIALSGSPNITMSYEYAAMQHRLLINNTDCGKSTAANAGSDLAKCLRSLPAKQLREAFPSSWTEGTSLLPDEKNPKPSPGLVIVDGVTVVKPLPEALKEGLIDVPLLISIVRDEADMSPNKTVDNWTSTANAQSFFNSTYAAWGNHVPAALNSIYTGSSPSNDPVEHPSQIWYDFLTQATVTCGNLAMAKLAGKGFKNKVYFVYFMQPVSKPFRPDILSPKALYPCHIYDWVVAQNAWNAFRAFGGDIIHPDDNMISLSATMRQDMWLPLASGQMLNGIKPITHAPSGKFPQDFNVVLLGSSSKVDGATNSHNHLADLCQQLEELGFDSRYWWIN